MRLFIAVNFDQETVARLLAVQDRLRELGRGRFSRPENLHLTLAFLGKTAPGRVGDICRAMEETGARPLTLRFDRTGCFHRDGGDIWWAGLAENSSLADLQRELCCRLSAEGFSLENRSFSPHITLARDMRPDREPDRRALLGEPFAAHADTISLMLSHRIDGRLTYTKQYAVRAEK